MKITCQSCQSKYTVSDEKVQGKTVKIKCRKCGATILVNSTGAVAAGGSGVADPVSAAASPADGTSYLVNVGDGDQRTMSLADVIASYNAGVVGAETYVWADGMADWQPLGQVDAIVAALSGGAAPAPAASGPGAAGHEAEAAYAAAAASAAQPAYAAPAAEPAYGAAAQPAYGAAAQPAYGASQPGYGAPSGFEAQAAYAAPAAQPAQPAYGAAAAGMSAEPAGVPRAAARREAVRASQDLFSAPGQEVQRPSGDVATSAPLFGGGGIGGPAAGAVGLGGPAARRDENSVLFSLGALTAKAAAPAQSSRTTAGKEDSGVIDLKALADGANAPSPAAAIVPDDGGLFQLSAPIGAPTTAAPSVSLIAEPPPKNRGPLYVGVGIGVAGLAIALAFFAARGGDPPPPVTDPAAQVQTAPPVLPPPVETSTALDPGASPSATATASATAKAPTGPRVGPRPGGGPSTKTTAGGATTATPPKPSGGNCGCSPSDLMCNMQCSAKGGKKK
jgi:predicted Zn finger-like uncharacterized protein